MIMKKILLFVFGWMVSLVLFSQETKVYPIKVCMSDFRLISSNKFTRIKSDGKNVSYRKDESLPELPYISLKYLLPSNANVESVTITNEGKQLLGKYILPSNPTSTNNIENSVEEMNVGYDTSKTYSMSENAEYRQFSIDGYQVLYMSFCPFEYNAQSGELYFKTCLSLKCTMTPNQRCNSVIGHNMRNIVGNIIENGDEMDLLYSSANTYLPTNYLIITVDSLKSSFEPLLETKSYKGMNPLIITKEDILHDYSNVDSDLTEKIKLCIRDYYLTNNIGYVLLGGDCNIIPTRMCYCVPDGYNVQSYYVPTDWYYACLDGNITWDDNRNGLYGDFGDNIDYGADVFVSRIPVTSVRDVKNYVAKRISYELANLYHGDSYKNILFAGRRIGHLPISDISDTHYWGQLMIDNINQLFNANITYVYDTGSNIGDTLFSAESLQRQFNKEFAIINIDTHGDACRWCTGEDYYGTDIYYTTDSVMNITSQGNTVVFSSSCHSNDFTQNDCLGKRFILGTNTLLYCGETREGLTLRRPYLNGSLLFDQMVYDEFFSGNHNIGECIYQIKLDNIYTGESTEEENRWILYSKNILGDPELNLYLESPDRLIVDASLDSENITIRTNEEFCTFTQNNNIGHQYETFYDCNELSSAILNNDNIQFGVYKAGWIPFMSNRDFCHNLNIANYTDNNLTAKAEHLIIGIDENGTRGNVIINSGRKLQLEVSKDMIIMGDFTCELGGTLSITPKQ